MATHRNTLPRKEKTAIFPKRTRNISTSLWNWFDGCRELSLPLEKFVFKVKVPRVIVVAACRARKSAELHELIFSNELRARSFITNFESF